MTEWKRQVGDETVYRTCAWSPPGCHPVGCGLQVHVKDGRVTKVEGDPEHPITKGSLCPRCLALKEYIYHPDRVTHPLKRAKEDRGKDTWEQCSWDEAIDIVATNANEIIEKYGGETICVFGGTGREANNWYPQWANLVFGSPNSCYAQAGWSCYGPRMSNTAFMIGGGYPEIDYAMKFEDRYEHEGWVPPEVIVLWGKEPLRSNPDGMYGHAIIEMMIRFGTKIICVDPRITWIGTRAEEVLQVRPGTDTAMAMAWIYVLAHDDLVDREFIDMWTYGYDELVQRVQDMPPSRAAEICGVPEEQIWRAARLYGNAKPSSLAWGLSVDENPNGTQLGQCLIALMTITGFLDAPGGTTLGMGDDQGNAVRDGGAIASDEKVDDETDSTLALAIKNGIMSEECWNTKRIGVDKYPAVGAVMWTVHPDEFIKALETGDPYQMHMALFVGSNPVGTAISAEPQRWHKALKKLDFNFACDLFMNPTTMSCCDVFLPVASTIEHDGMVVTHYGLNASFYGAQNKCVQVGECKSDVEIMMMVGKRTFPDFWNRFETEEDYNNFHVMRSWLPYTTLREKVTVMSNEPYYKFAVGKLRPDGQLGFPTTTGRVELYSYAYANWGEDPLPYFDYPAYGPEHTPELMKEYPFILTTGARRQEFFHSEHKQVPSLRQLTPYPQLDINPRDAERLGINENDWVEIESPYAKVRQRAHVVPTIKEGVAHAMHGWWYPEEEGAEPNLFGNWKANINMLMPNSVNGKLGFGNTFKQMIVKLAKVDGEGGPNDPTDAADTVEPSRAKVFTVQQVWRPEDKLVRA
ncbi:MAG: molybdopterin-dependent oxidoreductase [Coriobacteriales bacterium]|nr:molybdopterin-dependent oxidoreductase [Coriobacteriales bacterium]